MKELYAILFDFDGVVIDSEPVHARAKRIVLEKFNIPYPETIFNEYKGIPDKQFFDYVSVNLDNLRHSSDQLHNEKKQVFDNIQTDIKLVPGIINFISEVRKRGIKTAMVSSTSLYSLDLVDKIFHIYELFDLIITEVDTVGHKPHPDPYLKAMNCLDIEPVNVIVIEDSPNGIISARDAGCFVYGLTTSFEKQILLDAGANNIIGSFEELDAITGIMKINHL